MFSPQALVGAVESVCRRFTFVVVYAGLLTLFAWVCIWSDKLPEYLEPAACVGLTLGLLLSLASYLWCEYLKAEHRNLICQPVVLAVAIANFFYIYLCGPNLSIVDGVGYGAAYVAALVAIFFVPVVRRSSIKLQWNYTCGVLGAVAFGLLISIVMGIFVSILYGTLNLLFSFSSERFYVSLLVVMSMTLPVVAALCNIPRFGELEHEDIDDARPAVALFSKNVLLPLALVYTLILYVYGFKILATWNLPNGNVCWMVIGLVTVCLLIIYGVQGFVCNVSTKETSKKIAWLAMRYIPMLLLPLLLLMSVAIFYRIGEYGITASRLYVATFNIWAYAVAIYLISARLPKLNLVASSFAILFLLTSIVPGFNYCTLGLESVRSKVKERLVDLGAEELPIPYNQMIELLKGRDEETVRSIASDLEYLDDWNDHRAVADIVTSKEKIMEWRIMSTSETVEPDTLKIDTSMTSSPIPEGFNTVQYVRISGHDRWNDEDFSRVAIDDTLSVSLPIDSLRALDENAAFVPVVRKVDGGEDMVLVLISVNPTGSCGNYINFTGYLFRK